MTRLWLRADGAPDVGIGHLGRAVALGAEAAARRIATVLVTERESLPSAIADSVRASGINARRPDGETWTSSVNPGDLVWFDGYGFTAEDRRRVHRAGAVVGAVDDLGTGEEDVDVVLNPNDASVTPPARQGRTLLLGPAHALINPHLSSARRVTGRRTATLLLTFGGSDPAGLGPLLIQTLVRRGGPAPFRRAVLVEGPSSVPVGPRPLPAGIEVVRDPPDMATLLAGADAAVTAAGSTVWDLLYLGVPTLAIQVVANQAGVARTLRDTGTAMVLDQQGLTVADLDAALEELGDPLSRARLALAGPGLVDGRGAARVLDALLERSAHQIP